MAAECEQVQLEERKEARGTVVTGINAEPVLVQISGRSHVREADMLGWGISNLPMLTM
jgi:hypothetical protein